MRHLFSSRAVQTGREWREKIKAVAFVLAFWYVRPFPGVRLLWDFLNDDEMSCFFNKIRKKRIVFQNVVQ
jgi:hypothetical protein